MFISIIVTCFKARNQNFDCPMAATAFVVPLGLFFPIQQFGSFYGQWGNLFTWFALLLLLLLNTKVGEKINNNHVINFSKII